MPHCSRHDCDRSPLRCAIVSLLLRTSNRRLLGIGRSRSRRSDRWHGHFCWRGGWIAVHHDVGAIAISNWFDAIRNEFLRLHRHRPERIRIDCTRFRRRAESDSSRHDRWRDRGSWCGGWFSHTRRPTNRSGVIGAGSAERAANRFRGRGCLPRPGRLSRSLESAGPSRSATRNAGWQNRHQGSDVPNTPLRGSCPGRAPCR